MRVVTAREFQDHASELLGSDELVLVTGEGRPIGLFLPCEAAAELPDGVRREVFARLTGQIRVEREARGVVEEEIIADFASVRRRRRRA